MLKNMRCTMFRTTRELKADQSKYNDTAQGESIPGSAVFSQEGKWSYPLIQLGLFLQKSSQGIIFMSTEVTCHLICDMK